LLFVLVENSSAVRFEQQLPWWASTTVPERDALALSGGQGDLPQVPPGAMGRFFLTQMVAVAELEAGLTSERTKACDVHGD
jgi:hypothetical protein